MHFWYNYICIFKYFLIQIFVGIIFVSFLAVHNSLIGDLVTQSVTHWQYFYFWHYRVTLETCDLWDICSEWRGDMPWLNKKKTPTHLPTYLTFSQLLFNFPQLSLTFHKFFSQLFLNTFLNFSSTFPQLSLNFFSTFVNFLSTFSQVFSTP